MAEITLINPPQTYLVEPNAQEHLGLMYLESYLKSRGVDVVYKNLANVGMDEVLSQIPESEYYGITTTILEYPEAEKLSEMLKERDNGKVLLGGGFVKSCFPYVNKDKFDGLVVGEGEKTLYHIVTDGLHDKVNVSEPILDLDSLPFPDHSKSEITGNFFIGGHKYSEGKSINLITSRGCPYDCKFCGSKKIWGGKVRYRSVDNVLKEIEQNVKNLGVTNIRFNDDNITHDLKRLKALCYGIEDIQYKYNTELNWRVSTRVVPSSKEMWKMMKDAGCKEVSFGIESYDPKVLGLLNKRASVYQNKKAIEDCSSAGIKPRQLMMINTPGEDEDTVLLNMEALIEQDNPAVSCKPFVVYPGTDIWDNPQNYHIKLRSKDFEKLNFNYFRWKKDKNGDIVQTNAIPNHINDGQTLVEMINRRERFLRFIEDIDIDALK